MFHRRQLSHQGVGHDGGCAGTFGGLIFFDIWSATQVGDNTLSKDCTNAPAQTRLCWAGALILLFYLWQHRTIPALRLKHRFGGCGTASALPKCSIMSGCGTRIVLRGQKPLALCDRCPCFGSLFPPLAALTFAASSIICAFGLASAAPRSPYRHLELCGIALRHAGSDQRLDLLTQTLDDALFQPGNITLRYPDGIRNFLLGVFYPIT